jgi:hypothetical protein
MGSATESGSLNTLDVVGNAETNPAQEGLSLDKGHAIPMKLTRRRLSFTAQDNSSSPPKTKRRALGKSKRVEVSKKRERLIGHEEMEENLLFPTYQVLLDN